MKKKKSTKARTDITKTNECWLSSLELVIIKNVLLLYLRVCHFRHFPSPSVETFAQFDNFIFDIINADRQISHRNRRWYPSTRDLVRGLKVIIIKGKRGKSVTKTEGDIRPPENWYQKSENNLVTKSGGDIGASRARTWYKRSENNQTSMSHFTSSYHSLSC